ncbi:MAG: methylaspartate mutase subunit E [Tissierellia bacterium]|nr:methylaspartate mutase subunit E [Tissierellia bacterium]
MNLINKKLCDEEFFKTRNEVLESWSTGKEVNLHESIEYLKKVPNYKNFSFVLKKAKKEGVTLVQPRAGVALIDKQIELLNFLSKEGGADLLPTTIDSYTRQNRYRECEVGINESTKENRSLLNGLPAVNYGIKGCRKIYENVDKPVQARHGTPDSRLLAEIIHASGWTSNEGGSISYNIPYAKNVSLEKSIADWQYCDRLVGFYEENGIELNREPFGALTGTLVPPSTSNACMIIEALLAAEQGVKNITVGYGQCGNLIQDVAAMRALEEQTKEYLNKYGYNDVLLTTVLHQWMGGFPADEAKAYGIISLGSTVASLSGATKVIVKTPHEAIGIPTMEANANGIKATKMTLNMLSGQRMAMSKELEFEINIIKAETKCIMDKIFELGKGDLAVGTVKGFEGGIIDIPFAPSKYNSGKMMPARDNYGAIRYLFTANIPFSKDLLDFNKAKLEERAKHEKRTVSFKMTVDDIYAVSKGKLIGRPN